MRRLRHYSMPNPPFQVYIVDDDPSICTAYARLVRSEKIGRVRTCHVETKALRLAEQWINERRLLWERRLDRLGKFLAENPD